ncbi:hypothetical protein [uncultured Methanoregula sp.]|uniref:hypothetical protein n=1 Tax=uncultured Methanoregula sp. TaxID=1005933 RepID=UPI002AAAB2A2|nr:hypothetical protein [uncultured Methanoregula sp.]
MKALLFTILSLALCAAILGAGCTQSRATPASPATGQAVPTVDLATLALTPSDVPSNFTLTSQAAKNPADVGTLARDLGWQGGYTVRYTGPAGANGVPGQIVQSIALYPSATIPDLIAMSDKQDRADTDLTYANLTPGTIGATSRGFLGKAPAGLYIKPTNVNPLVTGSEHHDVSAELKTDVAEMIISKGNVFEVIRMTGPGADTQAITALAEKAYAKIP